MQQHLLLRGDGEKDVAQVLPVLCGQLAVFDELVGGQPAAHLIDMMPGT